jgi:hypothetical protein
MRQVIVVHETQSGQMRRPQPVNIVSSALNSLISFAPLFVTAEAPLNEKTRFETSLLVN